MNEKIIGLEDLIPEDKKEATATPENIQAQKTELTLD